MRECAPSLSPSLCFSLSHSVQNIYKYFRLFIHNQFVQRCAAPARLQGTDAAGYTYVFALSACCMAPRHKGAAPCVCVCVREPALVCVAFV